MSRSDVLQLGVLLYECGAFFLSRALLGRHPRARIWLLILPVLPMGAGAVAGLYLPGLVPDRPTPALSVVYYGLYLLGALLFLMGLPFFVAAALPLPRAARAHASRAGSDAAERS